MPEPQLGYFFPVSAGHPGQPLPPSWGSGNRPGQPLPPIPPGLPVEPGKPTLPIVLPPELWPPGNHGPEVMPPIYIPGLPDKPITLPPGSIWPPLPPDLGIEGKVAILIWVSGVGSRWFIYDSSVSVTPPIQPTPTPK